MKKYNLFKTVGFMFLVLIILSWVIPVGNYTSGEFTTLGTAPIGISDLFGFPIMTIISLVQYGIIVALIGGLYGVINKTGVYSNFVEAVASKFSNKKNLFLIMTITVLSLLSSLLGIQYLLLILVPFLVAIILKLGFNKITALVSTIGSLLVGNIGAIYGETGYYIKEIFKLNVNNEIFTKIIFLVIITFLLVMFVLKGTKNKANEKQSDNKIPLYEDNNSKKSYIPLIVIFSLGFIFLVINMIDWVGLFNIQYFSNLHDKIIGISIGTYPIVSNILGSITKLGSWTQYDMCIFLCLMSIVIGWVYSLKLKDIIEGFTSGVKEMLVPAFYAIMANIIFVSLYKLQSSANIYLTITDYLLNLFENSKIIIMPVITVIGSFFYNTISGLTSTLQIPIGYLITDTTKYSLIGFIIQMIHGIMMLIVPTSMFLLIGLSYLKVSYKEWFKYIWKYLLQILVVSIAIMIIISIFV